MIKSDVVYLKGKKFQWGSTEARSLGMTFCTNKDNTFGAKGYFHLCPRMDFLQTLHINNSLYTNYENVFIEFDSWE